MYFQASYDKSKQINASIIPRNLLTEFDAQIKKDAQFADIQVPSINYKYDINEVSKCSGFPTKFAYEEKDQSSSKDQKQGNKKALDMKKITDYLLNVDRIKIIPQE